MELVRKNPQGSCSPSNVVKLSVSLSTCKEVCNTELLSKRKGCEYSAAVGSLIQQCVVSSVGCENHTRLCEHRQGEAMAVSASRLSLPVCHFKTCICSANLWD